MRRHSGWPGTYQPLNVAFLRLLRLAVKNWNQAAGSPVTEHPLRLIRQQKVNNLSTVSVFTKDAGLGLPETCTQKNRFLKAVFFRLQIQLSPPSFIDPGNVLQQPHPATDTSQIPTPLRFTHQKYTRNILRKFGAYAITRPDYPSKNRRKRFP